MIANVMVALTALAAAELCRRGRWGAGSALGLAALATGIVLARAQGWLGAAGGWLW